MKEGFVHVREDYGVGLDYTSRLYLHASDGKLHLDRHYTTLSLGNGLNPLGTRTESVASFDAEEIDFDGIEVGTEQKHKPMLDGWKIPDENVDRITIPFVDSNAYLVVDPDGDTQYVLDQLSRLDPTIRAEQ